MKNTKALTQSALAGLALLTLGFSATSAVASEATTLITRGPNGAAYVVKQVPLGATPLPTSAPGQAHRQSSLNKSAAKIQGFARILTRGPNGAAFVAN